MIPWLHETVTWTGTKLFPHFSSETLIWAIPSTDELYAATAGRKRWKGSHELTWLYPGLLEHISEVLDMRVSPVLLYSLFYCRQHRLNFTVIFHIFFLCSISPLLLAIAVVSSFMICLISEAGKEILDLMWEHFLLCIKETSANFQNTNKVSGCARTPVGKPGTNSACTTSRSAVFILECTVLCVSFIFGYFSSIFSFYWSKLNIANKL